MCIFFISSYSIKQNKYSLEILKGLDISSFNEEFYLEWKTIDWHSIFNNRYFDFLKKISDLINNLKDFIILFKLYNISKDNNQYDFIPQSISLMQNKFIELYNNYPNAEEKDFLEVIVKIIYSSDIKNVNVKSFLENNLQNITKYK